jgi:hypothetical protein
VGLEPGENIDKSFDDGQAEKQVAKRGGSFANDQSVGPQGP